MNEVKRYDFDMLNCDEPSIGEFREHTEGDYTKFADFQSERAARIAAETKLSELGGAIAANAVWASSLHDVFVIQMNARKGEIIFDLIANSKARSKS